MINYFVLENGIVIEDDSSTETIVEIRNLDRPKTTVTTVGSHQISLDVWLQKFGVSSKFIPDTNLEHEIKLILEETNSRIKEATIRNRQRYQRLNQMHQAIF